MAKASRLKPDEVEEVFRRFQTANPEPKGELHYVNPYTLLVAVVLSAQATDEGVNKATKPLFAIADTPQKMVALGEDTVRNAIKTIRISEAACRAHTARDTWHSASTRKPVVCPVFTVQTAGRKRIGRMNFT